MKVELIFNTNKINENNGMMKVICSNGIRKHIMLVDTDWNSDVTLLDFFEKLERDYEIDNLAIDNEVDRYE